MLRVVGAGLPRTATSSLKEALEQLLGGRCYHMHELFRHPEDLPAWRAAIGGEEPDWRVFPPDCVATLDWPASAFWRELRREPGGDDRPLDA
jgi:sulfotransferase family protein